MEEGNFATVCVQWVVGEGSCISRLPVIRKGGACWWPWDIHRTCSTQPVSRAEILADVVLDWNKQNNYPEASRAWWWVFKSTGSLGWGRELAREGRKRNNWERGVIAHMDEDAIVNPIILYVNSNLIWRKEVKDLKQNQAFVCTAVGRALLQSYNLSEDVKFKTAMVKVCVKPNIVTSEAEDLNKPKQKRYIQRLPGICIQTCGLEVSVSSSLRELGFLWLTSSVVMWGSCQPVLSQIRS